jgi:phosphatidylserine decarboxylase
MIAREGYPFIVPVVLVAILCWLLTYATHSAMGIVLALLATLAAGFFTYFFRDPERTPPPGENLILSPGDGKVIVNETRTDGNGTQYQLVSIFLSVFDVHVNRIPVSGDVGAVKHIPGRFHRAFEPEAVTENERTEIVINSAFGAVRFSQVAGILARRIVCRLQLGDRVTRGERFGMIRFGSRVDLFLDPVVQIDVKLGDRVTGGVSVIGRFPQNG